MAKPETITSAANPLLKEIRRAIARGGLTAQGWCVAETFHLLEEALRSDCEVKVVVAADSVRSAAESHVRALRGIKVVVAPDAVLQSISGTESSQGILALVKPPEWKLEQLFRGCPLVVVLDALQDPGNCGTIVRAAEGFGASGVLFLKGTASPYNPKTLRASAGSLFRVPFLAGVDPALARAALRQNRIELYAGVPAHSGTRSLSEVDFTGRCGLIIGNEGRGVGSDLRSAALDIAIPTVGVESLNAAVSAGILLYEARRQRALRS
ncbi:MAG TPA: RNA methyltransferase [Bryobacteraceae bacterium]|nr:RNA methyltransferase [Bryobacteraceae bacterium]